MKRRFSLAIFALLAAGLMALPAIAADGSKDKEFVTKAAQSGLMEVQLGQLASEKASSQDVKDFGKRMVADHGKANEELKKLAQKKQMTIPTSLDKKYQEKVDKVRNLSGGEFDKKYMHLMVKAHTKDVAQFQAASKDVKDPDLKAWVVKTLPTLEQHLKQAKALGQKVGVDVNAAEKEGREAMEKKKS